MVPVAASTSTTSPTRAAVSGRDQFVERERSKLVSIDAAVVVVRIVGSFPSSDHRCRVQVHRAVQARAVQPRTLALSTRSPCRPRSGRRLSVALGGQRWWVACEDVPGAGEGGREVRDGHAVSGTSLVKGRRGCGRSRRSPSAGEELGVEPARGSVMVGWVSGGQLARSSGVGAGRGGGAGRGMSGLVRMTKSPWGSVMVRVRSGARWSCQCWAWIW